MERDQALSLIKAKPLWVNHQAHSFHRVTKAHDLKFQRSGKLHREAKTASERKSKGPYSIHDARKDL